MSRFGDDNLKSDVYENLGWIISEEPMKQIDFLHMTITELATNGLGHINNYIVDYIQERNLTTKETLEDLGEVYSSIVAWDLISDN